MSDRDEKTAIGVQAPTGDRTMVRAKSTLSDAFSDRTIVYDPNAKPKVPPPPVPSSVAEATTGGAKQIRPPDTAALAVSEAIAEEATDPGLEPVVKKQKKKKAQKAAPVFPRIDKRVFMGIGVGIAAVALVVMFGSPSDKSSPRAEEESIAAQEEPQVERQELASVAAPPPKPAQVIKPQPTTDASTAQALEIFDQAVRRTQERASQKVEQYGF